MFLHGLDEKHALSDTVFLVDRFRYRTALAQSIMYSRLWFFLVNSMPIEDLARSDAVTAPPETPVTELAATMDEENVGSVVITDGETPVGIVTDRDLTVRVLGEQVDPGDQTAEDVMTTDLCTAQPDAGFYEAANLMADNGIRRLPICEGDSLVGIITADDISELLADEQQHLGNILRAQRPEY